MGKFNLAELLAEQNAQPPQVRDIEVITTEILDAKRAGGEAILTIGKGLIEAKALMSHGEWLPWLEERVEFSEKAAQRFMRLAREYSNPTALSDLGATKALMLLAIPTESREEFISTPHMVGGEEKSVIDMTSRELEAAIKERDEARMAAEQAKAGQSAAEQAREKISQDMKLANERVEGLSAELRDRQKTLDLLTAELKRLKERPVEVAVESDPAAIEAARKETKARMQGKLDQAKKAYDKARSDLAEVNSALQRAKLEREQVEAELRKQLEAAEKKTAISADADMVLFSELYEQAQILVKRMGGVRLKKLDKDPEKAEGLSNALMALIPVVKEAAGHE